MASPRPAARGRVLGTRSVSSPSPALPEHLQRPGLLSPSASSISIDSQFSTSKSSVSIDDNDISTVVALQARDNVAVATAGSRLVCPICTDEMVTLLQLNRHLDDNHGQLEEREQDEVKNWFKTQMVKAKKFQPLAVINQKLKGLDRFESNEDLRRTSISGSPRATSEPVRQDPDDVVTREHWQKHTPSNACSDPMCGRRLGGANGNVNCKKCGKLFCEEHTMYQMKLSRSAQHEPVRGVWCRVCETCYKSREGYNDHSGVERDLLSDFASTRRKAIDKSYLEISRLEKRLTKLTQLLANPAFHQEQGVVSYLRSFSGAPKQQRVAEQSVVEWEDDAKVARCPFCQQEFTNYSFRRHHCRLCGRVVCADLTTACSSDVALNIESQTGKISEKGISQIAVDIRMCKDCRHTVFSKSDFARELAYEPADQRAYQNLKQFERGIRIMMPRFQKLLTVLQDPDKPPTQTQLTDATKVRKRLTDAFTQYSVAAQRIRDLPTTSPTQSRLQKQIYIQSTNFLHIHMLPLKSLPKILKHATPTNTHNSTTTINGHLAPPGPLAAIKHPGTDAPSISAESGNSSNISSLEAEEKELRERLIVLEEQKFMVGEMLADAQRRRKFEEVEVLTKNLEEVGREVDSVQRCLGNLDFEGAWLEGTRAGGGFG